MSSQKVTIFTDGGCRGNPGPGGWGAVLQFGDQEKEIYGYDPETTNNRMELMAAISALEMLKRPCEIDLTTDSHEATQRHNIEWHWIKGHSGHHGNERADDLANRAMDEKQGNT